MANAATQTHHCLPHFQLVRDLLRADAQGHVSRLAAVVFECGLESHALGTAFAVLEDGLVRRGPHELLGGEAPEGPR